MKDARYRTIYGGMELIEFKEMYPNGLRQTIRLFEQALYKIMSTNEIDKVIACADPGDREKLEQLKESFDKDSKWYQLHYIPAIMTIESPELFRDIITHMVMLDDLPVYKE